MTDIKKSYEELEAELTELSARLDEANETIDAIRTGSVDALVLEGEDGAQVYTLKSADQTYRVFIEKMNEGAVTINKDGLIVYCNSRFAEMVNAPLQKVTGVMFINFIPAEHKLFFKEIINKAWLEEIKGEIILQKNDGETEPCLFSLTTLELDEGTALSIILTDLSAQKEIEHQLKQKNAELEQAKLITEKLNNELEDKVNERTKELFISREHFKFLADNIPVIAWKALPDGVIDYYNKRWYEYTGRIPKEGLTSIKAFDLDIIHPDDKDEALEKWQMAVLKQEAFAIEYRLKRYSDGTFRWHLGNAVPYKNEHGKIIAWFGIATDINDQKIELEKKDDFISTVSHELKTPVTSLKGFTQLLIMTMRKDGNATTVAYLEKMDNQINKLTRLISDLLDATKFNRGQLKYNEEFFDFNDLVREISNEMQLTTSTHKIKLLLGDSAKISGDRNRIGQVVTNLISNAIKYSPRANFIEIKSAHNDNQIELCVKDFGIGIPESQQSQLYNRFFRVTDSVANTFPGMGLGLFISKGIIEKHHGKMWVTSKPGDGSMFYFSLPVKS
jgi:two-component system phosphate regulon sensor histidine kinase PhoR